MHWLERTALTGFWVVAAVALFGIATAGGGRGTASAADRSDVRETELQASASDVAQLATARCSEALALLRASESPLGALACFARSEPAAAAAPPVDVRLPGAPLDAPPAEPDA